MNAVRLLLVLLGLSWAGLAGAVIETYEFSDPLLEERYQALSAELRCPKCQNQNIADSNAPIAQDLRKLLYQQLEEGASDEQILQYMVARYGEFVRYRPSFTGATALLWMAPLLLLGVAVLVVLLTLRSRRETVAAAKLSTDDQQALDELLNDTERNT